MSGLVVDADGFIVVKSRRTSKNKHNIKQKKEYQTEKEVLSLNIEKTTKRILDSVSEVKISEYFLDITKALLNVLNKRKIREIVSFGLGHIGECSISRYQLALLHCFKDLFDPQKVLVHDPILSTSECKILNNLNIDIIKENQEGSYVISDRHITLVYLPHCPKQLTNNFLWSNWNPVLENCILICNSFTALVENQPSRILSETVPYIYKIFPSTSEIKLENNFRYTDIFNDTSIHYFQKRDLDKLDLHFWKKESKPLYHNSEEFITRCMIEKLNI